VNESCHTRISQNESRHTQNSRLCGVTNTHETSRIYCRWKLSFWEMRVIWHMWMSHAIHRHRIRVAWPLKILDMTDSYVWHDSYMCVTQLARTDVGIWHIRLIWHTWMSQVTHIRPQTNRNNISQSCTCECVKSHIHVPRQIGTKSLDRIDRRVRLHDGEVLSKDLK